MCKLRNYICYSVLIPCDMPFSDMFDRVCLFCKHESNIGRFQEYVIIDCGDYTHVYVRGGSKRDWKKNFDNCTVREVLFDDYVDIMRVLHDMIGEPLYYKKLEKGE